MRTLTALGLAGGFLFVARRWLGLILVLWIAARVSHALAVAVLREALRSGVVR